MIHIWQMVPIQKLGRRLCSIWILIGTVFMLLLYNWVAETIPQAHIRPEAKQLDIQPILERKKLTEAELQILSAQTGLHPDMVELYLYQGRQEELLQIQNRYFAPVHIGTHSSTPITISEHLVDEQGRRTIGMPLANLRNGDILITKNSRFLGWRNGHAALVVDAKKGLVLEAIVLGTVTKLSPIEKWSTYPSFQVLRLKDEYAEKPNNGAEALPQKIAAYAEKNLTEIPYHLHAGIFERISTSNIKTVQAADPEKRSAPILKGTHCAHLVWYAYKQFGIDLDSDGGLIVTPCDIQNSDYLEVIQSYGY